jgi:catechol 2,3-dioxygenase-like lactoylglutathione lyase family enzyme
MGITESEVNSKRRWMILFTAVLALAPTWMSAQGNDSAKSAYGKGGSGPVLVNTCLISADVRRLARFYESVLGQRAKWSGETYAEFATGGGVLAIFSAEAQERYIPGSAEGAKNRTVILEFKVDDVDREYRRLKSLVQTWVKPPTTQPWGTRSIYFRDVDGNLVDFYAPVQSAAPKK